MSWEFFWQLFLLIGWIAFVVTLAVAGIIQEVKK
jgi:hypothetical protein